MKKIFPDDIVNGQHIRCYDNGGASCDRYTVAFMDQPEGQPRMFAMLGMNDTPFHPQGFCQHTSGIIGRHLGKRIRFDSLPVDCQSAVKNDCPA